MQNEGIRISVEKNVYKSGTLNFRIFNPETEDYGELNEFADENRLLRFASESRELTECAEELLSVLVSTYKRMKKITLEFKGTQSDYEILLNASKNVDPGAELVISPSFDLDPKYIIEKANEYIREINMLISANQFKRMCNKCKKENDIAIEPQLIDEIIFDNNPKELIKTIKQKVLDVDAVIDYLLKRYDEINKKELYYTDRIEKHEEDFDILKKERFLKYLLVNSSVNNSNAKIAAKQTVELLGSIGVSRKDLPKTDYNSLKVLIENSINDAFLNAQKKIKSSYKSRDHILDSTLEQYTTKIVNELADILIPMMEKSIKNCLCTLWDNASNQLLIVAGSITGSDTKDLSIEKWRPGKAVIKDAIGKSNIENTIRFSYDSGLTSFKSNKYRKHGVTEVFIDWKTGYKFNIDINKFLSSFDVSHYHYLVIPIADETAEYITREFVAYGQKMFPQFMESDRFNKDVTALINQAEKTKKEVLERANKIAKSKSSISGLLRQADAEGGEFK